MRTDAIPLAGGAYTDESRPFSMQDTLNLRAQRTEAGGTRAPDKLQTLPGLRPFVEVAGLDGVRGAHNAEGRLLAVMGRTLYRISAAGVAIPLGTVPGMGRVQIDHNQISLGNEVLAVNGSAGYLWNSVTNAFSRVSDPGFPGGSVVKFINGYFVVIEPQGRFAQSSAPAQGLSWNTLDRFTSEVSPDRLMSAGVRGSELLLLSASSGEFFQATANAQQPFRTKRIDFKVGAAGPHATIDADNNIWWLGSDGVFYCLNGYSQFRISTRPIENAIRGLDWSRAFVNRWDTVLYWTFPDGRTWGFDFAEKEWHRRESYGLNRWRVNTMTWWSERWIAGDSQAGRLWDCNLSDRYYLEGDTPYVVRRTLGVSHDNQNPVRCPRLELVMDTGQPITEAVSFPAQPDPPTITGDAPAGFIGPFYSFTYTLGSGTPPYVVTLAAGALPDGLALSSAGVLSGNPTTAGDSTFTVRVTDSIGLWAEVEDEVNVSVGIVPPILVTNNEGFEGDPASLVATASLGVGSGGGARRVRVSPNGFYAAYSSADSVAASRFGLKKWNASTELWEDLPAPASMPTLGPRNLAWSPDGAYLACAVGHAAPNNLVLYELVGDTLVKQADPDDFPSGSALCVAWDETGSRLAVGANLGGYVYDVSAGVLTNIREFSPGFVAECMDFMPGAGSPYLACGQAGFLYVVNTEGAPPVVCDIESAVASEGVFWDASANHIFVLSGTTPDELKVWTFDYTTPGAETLALTGAADTSPPSNCTDASITPDRAYLAAACPGDDSVYAYNLSVPLTPELVDTAAVTPNLETVSWREL